MTLDRRAPAASPRGAGVVDASAAKGAPIAGEGDDPDREGAPREAAEVDESPLNDETSRRLALRLAGAKAAGVAARHAESYVLVTMLTPDASQTSVWAYATDKRGTILARGELLVRLVEPHKHVVAVVGMARPEGLEDGSVELANIQPDELPEEWQSYAPLAALVWMDGRANEIRSSAQVEAEVVSAITGWLVARGL